MYLILSEGDKAKKQKEELIMNNLFIRIKIYILMAHKVVEAESGLTSILLGGTYCHSNTKSSTNMSGEELAAKIKGRVV